MKTVISMSATHDRSRPRGVDMNKIRLGDKFKDEDNVAALNRGIATLEGRIMHIGKVDARTRIRSHVTLNKAELVAIVNLFKKPKQEQK